MFRWINLLLLVALGGVSCAAEQPVPTAIASTNRQYYQAKGMVQDVKPEAKSVVIKHEAITNYMDAMTMSFDVKETNELIGLLPGDVVSFRMVVAGDDAWIDQIKKLDAPRIVPPPQTTFRYTREVEPLKVGDLLPDYHFTNELGQAVNTAQFKGKALAFTFFFTRCPFPTFCPLMSHNFAETQKKLLTMRDGPTNWQLLEISFDTDADSPQTLKTYAQRYNNDPQHWSFVTGDFAEVTAIAEQVGEVFWRESGSITHNLRTVVIDAQGRVQKIIPENKWTSDELVAEMVKAAAVK